MKNSPVASVTTFSNGVLVILVMGDLEIDIELIARQHGALDVSARPIESSDARNSKSTELAIAVDDPVPLLLLIHEYLNSIGYSMKDDLLGSYPSD